MDADAAGAELAPPRWRPLPAAAELAAAAEVEAPAGLAPELLLLPHAARLNPSAATTAAVFVDLMTCSLDRQSGDACASTALDRSEPYGHEVNRSRDRSGALRVRYEKETCPRCIHAHT